MLSRQLRDEMEVILEARFECMKVRTYFRVKHTWVREAESLPNQTGGRSGIERSELGRGHCLEQEYLV